MSDYTTVIVGLKQEELTSLNEQELEASGLRWKGYGYESSSYWIYKIQKVPRLHADPECAFSSKETKESGSIYGIKIAATWSGAIELDSLKDRINRARKLFKEITGLEAKVYLVGEQV